MSKSVIARQRSAITTQARAVKAAHQRAATASHELTASVATLAELVKKYNRERLTVMTDFLISRGLAYYAESRWQSGQLVKENDLFFHTEEGVEEVWRGSEYYERLEHQHYKRTKFVHGVHAHYAGSRREHDGVTVRQRWVGDFQDYFADRANRDLPAWLLIAVDDTSLPKEPIKLRREQSEAIRRIGRNLKEVTMDGADIKLSVICLPPD